LESNDYFYRCLLHKSAKTEINDQLSSTGDRNKIYIRGIETTLRCEMKTAANVSIDFTYPNSINTILGLTIVSTAVRPEKDIYLETI